MGMGSFLNWRHSMVTCELFLCGSCDVQTLLSYPFRSRGRKASMWGLRERPVQPTPPPHQAGPGRDPSVVWHPWYLPVTMKMLHTHALSSRDALWWDFKIPLFFRVSPENAIFPRCSTRGRLNYADLHVPQHATVVSVGCTHACHAAAFSLLIYDMEVRMGFSFSSIPSAHGRMAFPKIRSLPSEPKGVGYTGLPKFKLLAKTGKRGSWVGFLSLLSFSGRDIGGRFELWGILLKYRERGS